MFSLLIVRLSLGITSIINYSEWYIHIIHFSWFCDKPNHPVVSFSTSEWDIARGISEVGRCRECMRDPWAEHIVGGVRKCIIVKTQRTDIIGGARIYK